ncbi:MAG: glycosyltransferase family 2 protein [Nitrospirae bacterium]|nr:glycosyltransferase family 2 protein [Nitrospirota bacterium]
MEKHISVVIPNCNNAATIGKCLEAAFASQYKNFEVIVVDDKSKDNSVEIIKQFPCRLVCLENHAGASKARNTGAQESRGEYIFFIDADCLLQKDTLSIVNRTLMAQEDIQGDKGGFLEQKSSKIVTGGTYTRIPYDKSFFSIFQSVFVNYSETRTATPDYIAAHAMIISAEAFNKSEGFPEVFLPIIEDVEFTHRLRRTGFKLTVNPEIQVQHIFNFTFLKSMHNAFKKTKYWVMYSLKNKDLLADSGSASTELKTNVVFYFLSLISVILWIIFQQPVFLYFLQFLFILNTVVNRRLLKTFYETKGILFGVQAFLFYTLLYPLPVGFGTLAGIITFMLKRS